MMIARIIHSAHNSVYFALQYIGLHTFWLHLAASVL